MDKVANVFSYDRPGYGYSGIFTTPRHANNMSIELYSLLLKTKIPPPYILVSHGYGSSIIKKFYEKFPEYVDSMVMVDPYHENEMNQSINRAYLKLMEDSKMYRIFSTIGFLEIMFKTKSTKLWNNYIQYYPSELQSRHEFHMRKSNYWTTKIEEAEKLTPALIQANKEENITINIPIYIVSSGIRDQCDRLHLNYQDETNKKFLESGTNKKEYIVVKDKNYINILDSKELKEIIRKSFGK